MGAGAPQGDYTELSQLASRIATHLTKNPSDHQARADLRYVVGQLRSGATAAANAADLTAASGPQTPNPGAAIGAGLQQAAGDIPRGVLQSILHPIQTAGQVTGIGNWQRFADVQRDPNASEAEKWDAMIRATPLNLGYGTERALLNATGAKSDAPQSLEDQAHAAGNVASLALLGAKPAPVLRVVRGGLARVVLGDLLKRVSTEAPPPAPASAPVAAPSPAALIAKRLGITLEQAQSGLDRQAARSAAPPVSQEPLLPMLRGAPDPLDAPAFARNARPAEPPASGLLPYYPRGGAAEQALPPSPVTSPPVIGPASPEIIVRSSSYADLMQALEQPALTARARQAILGELQRRGIVGSGLLAPAAR
jgi:hypothetical protein